MSRAGYYRHLHAKEPKEEDVELRHRVQEIVTGLRNTNESEVISGLNEGDELVVVQKSGLSFGN